MVYTRNIPLIRQGKQPEVDYAITNSLLAINTHRNKYAQSQRERIWKLLNMNDSLDGLEGLIANKIELGLPVWGVHHVKIKKMLDSPLRLAFSNPDVFNKAITLRHKLYVDALTSLGYAAKDKEIYDLAEKQRVYDEAVLGE